MIKPAVACFAVLYAVVATAVPVGLTAQAPSSPFLARHYHEGDTFSYQMTTSNKGRTDTLNYTIRADATVKRDADGKFFEEIA